MRIGLFGGAFNPVHNGHIAVMRAAIDKGQLDRLILIPSGNAPHKKETEILRSDRLKMLQLVAENEPKIQISDYEFQRDAVSYSADTVEYFKGIYPDDELFFIIGDDSYNNLSSWYEPQRILDASTLLVFPREGAKVIPPAKQIEMNRVEISSSEIRLRIKLKKDCRNLLPKSVFDYIMSNGLYAE